MKPETKTVAIDERIYDQLVRDSEFLSALQCCGVDNWDGYEEAQVLYDSWQEEGE